MMPISSSMPVPELTSAGAYASSQQPHRSTLDIVARDALILYALLWLWHTLTRPRSRRRARSRPIARSATGLCRCGRHEPKKAHPYP
jgi:hypothetical protein